MKTTPTQTQLLKRICGFGYSVTVFDENFVEFLNPKEDIYIVINLQLKNIGVYRNVKLKDGTWVEFPCSLEFKLFNILSEFLLTLEE